MLLDYDDELTRARFSFCPAISVAAEGRGTSAFD